MLDHLTLDGFKSFAAGVRTEIPLGPLTLLVGPNASGKSNLLDAIRFLAGVGQGLPLSAILHGHREGGRAVWEGIRGGAFEATFKRTGDFTLLSTWDGLRHAIGVRCREVGVPAVVAEALESPEGSLFEARQPVAHQDVLQHGSGIVASVQGVEIPGVRGLSLLSQLQFTAGPRVSPRVIEAVRRLRTAMASCTFLELSAPTMRGYSPKATKRLGSAGEDLSAVLWHLCNANPEMLQLLVDWVSELCAPRVESIDFVEVPDTGDVLAVLVEQGGVRITAQSMSDGTLRFLGMLAAAYSVEPGTTILLEEIENGLHPTRLHLLLELLDQVTTSRGIQVIATSHSPFALEALRPEVLAQALVFARHSDAEGTLVRPLGELPDFEELVQKRGIEHLFRSGWLERAL